MACSKENFTFTLFDDDVCNLENIEYWVIVNSFLENVCKAMVVSQFKMFLNPPLVTEENHKKLSYCSWCYAVFKSG